MYYTDFLRKGNLIFARRQVVLLNQMKIVHQPPCFKPLKCKKWWSSWICSRSSGSWESKRMRWFGLGSWHGPIRSIPWSRFKNITGPSQSRKADKRAISSQMPSRFDLPCLTIQSRDLNNTVDGWNPANQLRLAVYPISYRVLYIPGGCLGFLPSTVWLRIWWIPQPIPESSGHGCKGFWYEGANEAKFGKSCTATSGHVGILEKWIVNYQVIQSDLLNPPLNRPKKGHKEFPGNQQLSKCCTPMPRCIATILLARSPSHQALALHKSSRFICFI